MSLILDALKKARDLAGGKPVSAPPTALASFRFGRPSRSETTKRIATYVVLGFIIVGSVGYIANFWIKRLRKPRAVLIQTARPLLPPEPIASVPPIQAAANEPTPAEKPKEETANRQSPPAIKPVAPATAVAPVAQRTARVVPNPVVAPAKTAAPATALVPAARQSNRPAQAVSKPAVPPVQTAAASLPPTNIATGPSPAAPAAQPPSPSGRGEISPPSRDPFELAVFYQKSGDYLKALEQYNKILEKDPLNAAVYDNVGLIHYATNNTLEAIKAFRQATYIDSKDDSAHNNLGLALRQAGQDTEAEREFERALQLNPKNAAALTNLAALAKKSGNIERAKVQYLQAIQANPENAEAHYNLAVLYQEQGEASNAIDHFKKFLALGSSSHPEVVADVERRIEELSKKKE